MIERHYTVSDVSDIFGGIHQETVYDWIRDGLFPNAVQVRNIYYIPAQDVQALLEKSRVNNSKNPQRKRFSKGLIPDN